MRVTAFAKLKQLIAAETDGCIIWPHARTDGGYGNIHHGGRNHGAHRLALELTAGPAPSPGMHAAHWPCGNKLCVNPRHLRWATPKENSADIAREGKRLVGELNPLSKLTSADVVEIRRSGLPVRDLADQYGMSRRAMHDVVCGKSYADVA